MPNVTVLSATTVAIWVSLLCKYNITNLIIISGVYQYGKYYNVIDSNIFRTESRGQS